jgi:hypothetical protein
VAGSALMARPVPRRHQSPRRCLLPHATLCVLARFEDPTIVGPNTRDVQYASRLAALNKIRAARDAPHVQCISNPRRGDWRAFERLRVDRKRLENHTRGRNGLATDGRTEAASAARRRDTNGRWFRNLCATPPSGHQAQLNLRGQCDARNGGRPGAAMISFRFCDTRRGTGRHPRTLGFTIAAALGATVGRFSRLRLRAQLPSPSPRHLLFFRSAAGKVGGFSYAQYVRLDPRKAGWVASILRPSAGDLVSIFVGRRRKAGRQEDFSSTPFPTRSVGRLAALARHFRYKRPEQRPSTPAHRF